MFLVNEVREDPKSTKSGPIMLNAGLVNVLFFRGPGPELLRNPNFCDFSGEGGGGRIPCPSGSAHEACPMLVQ